jgi:sporulation protein YlmC with PRC-barrel domain
MRATDIKGLQVLPEGSGSPTGTVNDLVLDPNERRVLALLVRSGDGDPYVLPVDDVRAVTGDALTARRDAAILPLADTPGYTPYPTFDRIFNQDAITESGENLGKVVDLEIDDRSWAIREYDVVKSYVEAFEQGSTGIPASRVETGARMIMVKDGEER